VHKETISVGGGRVTLCVEGNIGAGKSTWLDMVQSHEGELHEVIEVVPEPVDQWQDCNGTNLLELFYNNPKKYAFAFQQYVLITRLEQVCLGTLQ
jgi:deoxyadenosine/deoxycytidine kinase